MIYAPSGLKLPISQKEESVNTFLQTVSSGYNAQNKEFVKRVIRNFIEKNLEPEAQNALAVNRFLKNYHDFFQRG